MATHQAEKFWGSIYCSLPISNSFMQTCFLIYLPLTLRFNYFANLCYFVSLISFLLSFLDSLQEACLSTANFDYRKTAVFLSGFFLLILPKLYWKKYPVRLSPWAKRLTITQGTWYCLFFYPNRTVRKRVLKTQIQSFVRNQTLVKKRLTSLLTNNNSKWKEVNCLKRGKSERPMCDCFKFCIWLVERMGQVFWTKHKAKFSKTMAIPNYSLYWKFLCPTIRGDWYFLLQLSPFETFLARYSPQPSSK